MLRVPMRSRPREEFMTPIKGLVALVLALAPALATAETVYKYQRPDGSTVYSDVLLRGAKLIGRFELVPVPPPSPTPTKSPASAFRIWTRPTRRSRRPTNP